MSQNQNSSNQILNFPESISEQAFDSFQSAALLLKTNDNHKIFQLTHQAIQYSQFVTRITNAQPSSLPKQIDWHLTNHTKDFFDYLVKEIDQDIMVEGTSLSSEKQVKLDGFLPEFQSEFAIMRFLRLKRYQHSCALAVLELNNKISIEDSTAKMSILAEVLIKLAYKWSFANTAKKFGTPLYEREFNDSNHTNSSQNMLILAMGKFGGFELNFSSDIDLIFFYGEDGETQRGRRSIENGRFFQKVSIAIIKLLDETTQDGFVFRTDMRLRPYGDSGALTMSIDQAEDYYQEQGRDWERYAMVRARIITGKAHEKERLEKIIRPFAFRRYIDYSVIESLRNMKQMIQREVRRRELKNNIKLGAGGIREIEFMVQSLQLIQGGRDKKLQEKSILKVIPLLENEKLLIQEMANDLSKNYRFLRRLENLLQQFDEKQTQELPHDEKEQYNLAKIMGYESYTELTTTIDLHLHNTNNHFQSVFNEDNENETLDDDFYLSMWEGLIDVEQLKQYLIKNEISDNLNFELSEFIKNINDFRNSKSRIDLSAKGSKRLTTIMPKIIELCLYSNSPIAGFSRVINIIKSILKRTAYLTLLAENKPILNHLTELVGQSEWIAIRLAEHPILLDELLYPKNLYRPLKSVDLENELRQYLLRIEEVDEEAVLNSIRQFKQINELRVAAALLTGQLNISQVSLYLTQLAEVIISFSVKHCWRMVSARHGIPENLNITAEPSNNLFNTLGFAVIGYGKLGGVELGFNSDLDLVFLFNQDLDCKTNGEKSISVTRFYIRLSQKIIHFLSTRTNQGVLYEVDMRLRPSGNSGMLVSHIDSFVSYQKEEAWTWEHQALMRARCVFFSDDQFIKQFDQLKNEVINLSSNKTGLLDDIVNMRQKMRRQLDKSTSDLFDLKQGVGGLVDIEFLMQYFMLRGIGNGKSHTTDLLKTTPSNTIDALKKINIDEQDRQCLIHAYGEIRNTINLKVLNVESPVLDRKLEINKNIISLSNSVEKIWSDVTRSSTL
ncbi:MAG: bifunctional [glutamate--ammonia ligase]-adenylyl-L-tyrosine phosphorylase/[glutamate--ammonia-ligase] adenylyltransferase [Kangiellaceae bacterium]